ncbi:MAG: glycolate oxidase subunit GlcE [Alphaproteobacteria bacterium]
MQTTDSVQDLAEIVAQTDGSIRVVGGDSGQALAGPVTADQDVSTSALNDMILFEPTELVVGCQAGMPLPHLKQTLAEKRLMLPFDAPDYRSVLGTEDKTPTIGGLVAGGHSGPARLVRGALRDSLIGVKIINGKGEIITGGGRVMKNVTGYDLPKLIAGSWGTLGIITEATFKLLPMFETEITLALWDVSPEQGIAALSAALGTPYEVQAAAYLPASLALRSALKQDRPVAIVQLQSFAEFLPDRVDALCKAVSDHGAFENLGAQADLWQGIQDLTVYAQDLSSLIWRINCRPTQAAQIADDIAADDPSAETLFDWGGGRLWVSTSQDTDARQMRVICDRYSASAMLFRGPAEMRASLPALPRPSGGMAMIGQQVKAAFDPDGKFNPGRMPLAVEEPA